MTNEDETVPPIRPAFSYDSKPDKGLRVADFLTGQNTIAEATADYNAWKAAQTPESPSLPKPVSNG